MTIPTYDNYVYALAQIEDNVITQNSIGFVEDECTQIKLMYAHIVTHCVINFDYFSDDHKKSINNLINLVM